MLQTAKKNKNITKQNEGNLECIYLFKHWPSKGYFMMNARLLEKQ